MTGAWLLPSTGCRGCARLAGRSAGLDADPFGSPYIRRSFIPHISLTKLDRDDQPEAATISRRALAGSTSATPQALELCDIGENSEQWKILASFSPATPSASTPPCTGADRG